MIQLLLPWSPALGRQGVEDTASAVRNWHPWLEPRLVELPTPPGPESALAALDSAGEAQVLVWTGVTALNPRSLTPSGLGPLPAAVPLPIKLGVPWDVVEQHLHLPVSGSAETFAPDLIWAPDAALMAVIWRDSAAQLDDVLPHQLCAHHKLLVALPPTLRRLAPDRVLQPSQRLPAVWRERAALAWHDPQHPPVDEPISEAIWREEAPHDALTDLACRGLQGTPLTSGPMPYGAIKAAALLRNPPLLALAWEQLQLAPAEPQHWGLALSLWLAAGRAWPWTLPMPVPEQLPERHRLLLLQTIQAGWLPADNLDALLEAVPPAQRALQQLPATIDAVLDALPSLADDDREPLRQACLAAPASLRRPAFDWAHVDAADPSRLRELQQRISDSLDRGVGFSLVRLGDGEGLFLAGERPCLGGATSNGSQRDPQLTCDGLLPADRLAALIDRLLVAIESADAVGVPDLSQCLHGPDDYIRVLPILWRHLPPARQAALAPRLLPGGCHLHLFWLASGAYEQPPFTAVYGVIAPLLPATLAGRVSWQPIPGEKGHHSNAAGAAHYPVVYEETLAWIERQAAPGRLFLVGAGILGKIYCDAIRLRGGVAIDVGSVMDLCGGLVHSRGEARLNPFLVPLAARAFAQGTD